MRTYSISFILFAALATLSGCAADASPDTGSSNDEIRETPIPVDQDLERQLKAAVAGVDFISETDSPFAVLRAPILPAETVTAALVKQKFSGMPGTDLDGVALKDLAGQDEGDFERWFQSQFEQEAGADEMYADYFPAMRKVYDLMKASCTDLKVVYASNVSLAAGHDVGTVHLFFVGRTRSGTLIGLHTTAAWT